LKSDYRIGLENQTTVAVGKRVETFAVARAPRVGIVCDLREENWHSMNLVADMLIEGLRDGHSESFDAARLCPPMRRRFTRTAAAGARFNADRLLNRFVDYPRMLRRARNDFDLFHIVDHSYAQLLHALPPERTVVTCHDLDAFRCLLEPQAEPRSTMFRAMTRRVLEGFQRAARVACDSRATRDELLAHALLPPERLVVIPNGVHPAFTQQPNATAEREAARLLGANGDARASTSETANGFTSDAANETTNDFASHAANETTKDSASVDLLHVGSTIQRKRVDVLLRVFAAVRKEFPRARLVRVGGALTREQESLAARLGVRASVLSLPVLSPETLAAVYRRAALTLLPSEREGFGLPLVESMACATPVVASDLAVLREVGVEGAVEYCAVGDVQAWAETITRLLDERARDMKAWTRRREASVRRSAQFTWREYVNKVVAVYRDVLGSCI
jgi:glycosyltransferase involved in cell wall biosynthesis